MAFTVFLQLAQPVPNTLISNPSVEPLQQSVFSVSFCESQQLEAVEAFSLESDPQQLVACLVVKSSADPAQQALSDAFAVAFSGAAVLLVPQLPPGQHSPDFDNLPIIPAGQNPVKVA